MSTRHEGLQSLQVPAPAKAEPDLFRLALGAKDVKLELKPDASKQDVLSTLELALAGYSRIQGTADKLKPIIGRLLHMVSLRRLYKPEYPTLRGWIDVYITAKYGFSSSWAFDAMAGVRLAPTLSNEQFKLIGATKLSAIAKRHPKDPEQVKALIQAAETTGTVEEFSAKLDQLAPKPARPEPSSWSIAFKTRFQEIPDEWAKFCLRQDVQEWAESTDQGRILILCMAIAQAEIEANKTPVKAPRSRVPRS